jgi:hypothetical protein
VVARTVVDHRRRRRVVRALLRVRFVGDGGQPSLREHRLRGEGRQPAGLLSGGSSAPWVTSGSWDPGGRSCRPA